MQLNGYNRSMEPRSPGLLRRIAKQAKNIFLALLFLLVPVAGAFHPRLRRKADPDEKETGDKM